MTNKIFRAAVLAAAVVLRCSLNIIMGVLYGDMYPQYWTPSIGGIS